MPQAAYSALTVVSDIDKDFSDWYQHYPRKVARDAALRAYRIARKRGATQDQLVKGTIAYSAECASKEKRFIAHPATWLNGARWLDEIEAVESFAEPWPHRMRMFRKSGIWFPLWGPAPGRPGCKVPASLLK